METGGIGHFCEKVSPGCANCYAERMQPRFKNAIRFGAADKSLVELFLDEQTLTQPLRWTRPRMIFPCSMTDLFGSWVPDQWLDQIFAIMALTPHHTYQVLTKRADRMRDYFAESEFPWLRLTDEDQWSQTPELARAITSWAAGYGDGPLPNVWLGVSVEDQKHADERIPLLLQTPAAIRWLSMEPLLGPVNLGEYLPFDLRCQACDFYGVEEQFWPPAENDEPTYEPTCPKCGERVLLGPIFQAEAGNDGSDKDWIDWIVAGGESGPNARPMHPDWLRSIRDQSQAATVPFHFKQWGEYWPIGQMPDGVSDNFYDPKYGKPKRPEYHDRPAPKAADTVVLQQDGTIEFAFPNGAMTCCKVGKHKAGRTLDGQTHDQMPEVSR